MKKKITKISAVAVLTLFMVLSFMPATNAADDKKVLDLLEVEVTDYKSDGSTESRIVLMKRSVAKDLKEKFLDAETLAERLEVLKNFDLVSDDTTLKDWFDGMLEKAESIGLKDRNFLTRTKIRLPIMISALNKVTSVSIVGGSKRIGITPIIRLIELITKLDIPRADVIVTQSGMLSILNTKSVLSKNTMITVLGFTGHVGFVGTGIKIPLLMHAHTGYSALTFGLGLGFRVKRSNLNNLI